MQVIQSGWPLVSDDERFNNLVRYFYVRQIEYPQWLREHKHNPNNYWSTCEVEIEGKKILSEKIYSAIEYESIPPDSLQEIVRRTHQEAIFNHIMEQLGL